MTNDSTTTRAPQTGLKKNAVGVFDIVFFVLSAQAPLTGIVGVSAIAIALGNGAGFPPTYVVVGLVMLVFSVGFTTMTRYVPSHGGFSSLVEAGLGYRAGVVSAWLALLTYSGIQAAMYGLVSVTTSGMLQEFFGIGVPWWAIFAVTLVVILILGERNVKMGANVLIVLVALEVLILVAFAVGVFVGDHAAEGIDVAASFSPQAFMTGAPGIAIMFAIASMFGFESTTLYAAEAKDAKRTVPRATYISVAFISLLLTFLIWTVVVYYGPSQVMGAAVEAIQGDPAGFVTAPLSAVLGPWAAPVASVLLVTSLIAALLAFHNIINRYLHSMARRGILPRGLARTNRFQAPGTAARVQTVLAFLTVTPFALLGLHPMTTLFGWLSGLGVAALVTLYVVTSLAIFAFFRRTRADRRPWNTVVMPLLSAVLMAGFLALIVVNFDVLADADVATSVIILGIVPIVALVGWALAGWTAGTSERALALEEEAVAEAERQPEHQRG
ncbi:APC family permease [Leucobacter sp. CSA1]|uniref:APC family permease n=1 Tax=Leucobacter chromiisoli TaxID=2796471 RepID=A0A934Q931_9MICO|nr:APC family permease [Leucobacter chromiisoli]MBK0420008.1 APC family permease [Leucobacter chromiisoli]